MPKNKIPLRLNLDETAVRFYYKPRKGLVCLSPQRRKAGGCKVTQHASLAQQRKALSHIAVICDDAAIQPLIPQFILGNERVLPAAVLEGLQASLPSNIKVLRLKSSWNNTTVMKAVLKVLGESLKPFMKDRQPILLMDACSVHFAARVLQMAATQKLWPCFVPAQLTWLLQPLDTDCFSSYKQLLRATYRGIISKSQPRHELDAASVVKSISVVCRTVLQGRDWSQIFAKNGFADKQKHVRATILTALQLAAISDVNSSLPSLADLQECFPHNTCIPIGELFRDVCPSPVPVVRPPAVIVAGPEEPEVDQPWSSRLRPRRSSSSVALDPSAASSTTVPCAPSASPCPRTISVQLAPGMPPTLLSPLPRQPPMQPARTLPPPPLPPPM